MSIYKDRFEDFTILEKIMEEIKKGSKKPTEWFEEPHYKGIQDYIAELTRKYQMESISVSKGLTLQDQILYEIEQISDGLRNQEDNSNIIVRYLKSIDRKFEEVMDLFKNLTPKIEDEFCIPLRQSITGKGRLTNIPQNTIPQLKDTEEKIKFLRRRIKEIGPISKISILENDE